MPKNLDIFPSVISPEQKKWGKNPLTVGEFVVGGVDAVSNPRLVELVTVMFIRGPVGDFTPNYSHLYRNKNKMPDTATQDEIHDVFMDTFLTAWLGILAGRGSRLGVTAYMHTVIRHKVTGFCEKARGCKGIFHEISMSDLPPTADQERPLITTDIEASLQGMMILQLFDVLSDDTVELLWLKYLIGLSVIEIAKLQGKPYKEIASRLIKSRERLADLLAQDKKTN
ncbi:sigma-70 family RNA polymerase sigma factor [Candidatus Woesebacteria bacterium]|nr:sigma-70 family RNA polymerase sigma factor [Candidatus Woesebacteria bacterium]